MSVDDGAIAAVAGALAAHTGVSLADAEAQVRAAAEQMSAPTPEQMAQRTLVLRLNARLAGRVIVPARPVRPGVKGSTGF